MKVRIVRESGGHREVGGYVVPRGYVIAVDDPALDFTYEIDVDNSGAAPRVNAVVCIARPGVSLRGEHLRTVRVASVIRDVAERLALPGKPVRRGGQTVGAIYPLTDAEHAQYLRARRREERAGLRRLTDQDLRLVAQTYAKALADGQPPTKAVQSQLGLNTRAQAARWVRKARDAGHLGAAPGERRSGAQPVSGHDTARGDPNLPQRSVRPRVKPPTDDDIAAHTRTTTRRKQ